MRKTAALLLLGVTVMVALPVLAGDMNSIVTNTPQKPAFQLIGINDLAKLMANPNSHVHVYDANIPGVREKDGMIPGARPLTSDDKYDVAQELPSNKNAPLVFYCANVQCMASHEAAERAVGAGYKNVSVMVDGISGWRSAGKPVETADGTYSSSDRM